MMDISSYLYSNIVNRRIVKIFGVDIDEFNQYEDDVKQAIVRAFWESRNPKEEEIKVRKLTIFNHK